LQLQQQQVDFDTKMVPTCFFRCSTKKDFHPFLAKMQKRSSSPIYLVKKYILKKRSSSTLAPIFGGAKKCILQKSFHVYISSHVLPHPPS